MSAQKIALVTGGTRGIGFHIAKALSGSTCSKVIITGSGTQKSDFIENVKKEIASVNSSVEVDYLAADLGNKDGIKSLCNQVSTLCPKGVDILVNNAGFQYPSPIETFPEDVWDQMMSIMLTAPFLLIQNQLHGMKSRGWGRIINISSGLGLVGTPNKVPYATCKHAINGMTKAVALETATSGITCNSLCLGYVYTDLAAKQVEDKAKAEHISKEESQKFFNNLAPTHKMIEPEDVGPFVVQLCSDSMKNMTGSCIAWDGGSTAQ